MEERLVNEFRVINSAGKQTAGFMLGEMSLKDTLELEIKLLQVIIDDAKAKLLKLPV